mmetsp:Transcript_5449/g.22592  ORF Transcript_5449/g.22592 Transcript_5449/m.22592 type:complete len:207 (-) Transcript_5449:401-1021(-)
MLYRLARRLADREEEAPPDRDLDDPDEAFFFMASSDEALATLASSSSSRSSSRKAARRRIEPSGSALSSSYVTNSTLGDARDAACHVATWSKYDPHDMCPDRYNAAHASIGMRRAEDRLVVEAALVCEARAAERSADAASRRSASPPADDKRPRRAPTWGGRNGEFCRLGRRRRRPPPLPPPRPPREPPWFGAELLSAKAFLFMSC